MTPKMVADFAAAAEKVLASQRIERKTVLRRVLGEPSEVVWIAEPYRNPDSNIEISMQALYHAADFGRHCVPVVSAKDADGQPCLVRRFYSTWRPFSVLAEATDSGWAIDLPASLLRRDAARIALLDYLTGNLNRHPHSIFLDIEGRRILSADHSMCLGENGPSFEDCFRKGPIADLHLDVSELREALGWWEGVEWRVLGALGASASAVAERKKLLWD